jgi:hypothetical protein
VRAACSSCMGLTATTIVAASSGVYSERGVVDAHGLPTGEWKQTSGAGWMMSGPSKADALQFLPTGAEKPSRVIYVSLLVPCGHRDHIMVWWPQLLPGPACLVQATSHCARPTDENENGFPTQLADASTVSVCDDTNSTLCGVFAG